MGSGSVIDSTQVVLSPPERPPCYVRLQFCCPGLDWPVIVPQWQDHNPKSQCGVWRQLLLQKVDAEPILMNLLICLVDRIQSREQGLSACCHHPSAPGCPRLCASFLPVSNFALFFLSFSLLYSFIITGRMVVEIDKGKHSACVSLLSYKFLRYCCSSISQELAWLCSLLADGAGERRPHTWAPRHRPASGLSKASLSSAYFSLPPPSPVVLPIECFFGFTHTVHLFL